MSLRPFHIPADPLMGPAGFRLHYACISFRGCAETWKTISLEKGCFGFPSTCNTVYFILIFYSDVFSDQFIGRHVIAADAQGIIDRIRQAGSHFEEISGDHHVAKVFLKIDIICYNKSNELRRCELHFVSQE